MLLLFWRGRKAVQDYVPVDALGPKAVHHDGTLTAFRDQLAHPMTADELNTIPVQHLLGDQELTLTRRGFGHMMASGTDAGED